MSLNRKGIQHSPGEPKRTRTLLFWLVQGVVITSIAGAALVRQSDRTAVQQLPPMRRVPLKIPLRYDRPEVISDSDLLKVLYQLRPRLREAHAEVNHIDHALRFWGANAKFQDPQCLSGEEMREILLNHTHFCEVWGDEEPPLLECNEHCIGVRTQEGKATASHVDHTLASLAEIGTPLDYPVETAERDGTMADLVVAALKSFEINQVEYEWSALAFTLYFERLAPYKDKYGQELSFDRLADRLIRQRTEKGVCFGNHRLHTLAVMLSVDEHHRILSPDCRRRVLDHLKQVSEVLQASQSPEGFWNQYWATGVAPLPEDDEEPSQLSPLARKAVATGHALEWWALAPEEVHPSPEVIENAAHWLTDVVLEMDRDEIRKNYTFLSHVGHSLALWRGHEPAYFIEQMEKTAAKPSRDDT